MTQIPTLTTPTELSPVFHPSTPTTGAVWAHNAVWDVAAGTIDAYDSTGESVRFELPTVASVRADVVRELARAQRDAVESPWLLIRLGVTGGCVFSAAARMPYRHGLGS